MNTITPDLSTEELSVLHILKNVALESVLGLLANCTITKLPKGEVLLKADQSNRIMYLVLTGKLSVHLESEKDEPVAFVETGETVGEISVIDGSPTSAYVVVVEPVKLLEVDEESFWRLIGASHEFAKNLLRLLTARMRASNYSLYQRMLEKLRFERDALVDGLTGLNNRRWMNDKLPRLLNRYSRNRKPISVLMLDVDHFKLFNDTHGHAAGDQALRIVAHVLSSRLRPTDLSARYGGEEFVMILPDTDREGALVAAERVRRIVLETPIHMPDGSTLPSVSVSIGVAELAEDEDAHGIISRADTALYRAKALGRNRVES